MNPKKGAVASPVPDMAVRLSYKALCCSLDRKLVVGLSSGFPSTAHTVGVVGGSVVPALFPSARPFTHTLATTFSW